MTDKELYNHILTHHESLQIGELGSESSILPFESTTNNDVNSASAPTTSNNISEVSEQQGMYFSCSYILFSQGLHSYRK